MLKLLILAATVVGYNAVTYLESLNIDINATWGPEGKEDDTTIRTFTVQFDNEMIEDLVYRLKNRRASPRSLGKGMEYGMNSDELDDWVCYWANNYSFPEAEQRFNTYPQYTTEIQGLKIHYIHILPEDTEGKVVLPVLLMHGWGDSIMEFYYAIPKLMSPEQERTFAVELIIPSLPGFCFSDETVRQGMGAVEIAVIMRNLMIRIGHQSYYIVGGDWGAIIGSNIASLFSEECLGFVTTMGLAMTEGSMGTIASASTNPSSLLSADVQDRLYPFIKSLPFYAQELAYLHIQATKPYTIGRGLNDSPTALAAWLLQLIATGTNSDLISERDGGLSAYTKDMLLDNLMCYWIDSKITSTIRIYAETANLRNWNQAIFAIPTSVPTSVIQARHEVFYYPPSLLKTKFTDLVHVEVLDKYGHFIPMEDPYKYAELILDALERIKYHRESNNM